MIILANFVSLELNFINSEFILFSPGLLPFFFNFKAFFYISDDIKVSVWLSKFHSNSGSFMFVVFYNFS
jgi:hypothetical protein